MMCNLIKKLVVIFLMLSSLISCENLYITFHGGPDGYGNIGIYNLNGQYVGDLLSDESGHNSLRGMEFWNSQLFICSAKDDRIITNSRCGSGAATFSHSSFLEHPYDLAVDEKLERIYVSNQDGNNVIYFQNGSTKHAKSFVTEMTNPRGIDVDKVTSRVYIASKNRKGVYVFDSNGDEIHKYNIDSPIGVHIDSNSRILYISNRGEGARVISFNITSGLLLRKFKIADSHPTGLLAHNGILYVLGQESKALYTYQISTGALLQTLITFHADYPEQLILGPC